MFSLKKIGQEKDYEKLEMILRRHWLIPMKGLGLLIVQLLFPYIFVLFFSTEINTLLLHPILGPILILVGSTYILFAWLLFFYNFVDYYLDVWIITNERITNIEQKGLFARSITEIRFMRVQDVTSDVSGIIPTLFDFGSIHIQTAGTVARIQMKQIPHPHRVAKKIHELLEADRPYHEHKAE